MFARRTWCHILAAVFSWAVIAPVVWKVADRAVPYDLRAGATIPPALVPGEDYALVWEKRTFRKDCDGTIIRTIIDSEGVPWPTEPVPSLFVDDEVVDSQWKLSAGRVRKLPSNTKPGPIRILTRGEFKCNFIHHFFNWPIKQTFPDIYTTVLPRP